jgi:hypothetical protein
MRAAKPWKIAESAYSPGETALDEMNDSNDPNDSLYRSAIVKGTARLTVCLSDRASNVRT